MAIIVTTNAGQPLAGQQYELAGTIAGRGSELPAAIAAELGINPNTVTVVAPNVLVNGVATYTLSEGTIDAPSNRRVAVMLRQIIQNHVGDRDTVVMCALKACIRYGKRVRGMTRSQVVNLVGTIYDSIASDND